MPPSAEISLSLSGLDLIMLQFALDVAIDNLAWWRPREMKAKKELEELRLRIAVIERHEEAKKLARKMMQEES